MEQRFTYQGQQYEIKDEHYKDKSYMLDSDIPHGENYWSEQVPTDTYGGYPSDKGLPDFHFFYASNTGIPGPYRPRPEMTSTPTFFANGLQGLFYDTQNLKYTTENGKAPLAPIPLIGDKMVDPFLHDGEFYSKALGRDFVRKEKCGCGAGPLLPLHN